MRVNFVGRRLSRARASCLTAALALSFAWLFGAQARAQAQAPSPATVRGTVMSAADGAPQPGATVTVEGVAAALTDERGADALALPPGSYLVRAEAAGFVTLDQSITIEGGETPTLDFRLIEAASEVISIVGSRTPRSQLETPVPVDVITSDVLAESNQTETNQILATLAPSFNATHLSVVDGTDHIDPASLRGLGPEHVLVLVNGRRLHQTALVNVYNGGTVGSDLNSIPTSAIERIEVLRDGAASQYGSDAIAGVINIVLKESPDRGGAYAMSGITASNDGLQVKVGADAGMRLGDKGFLHLTLEGFSRERTNRSRPWTDDIFPGISGQADTDAELARRGLTRRDFTMQVGQAGALVGTTFLNAGYRLSDAVELHGHAGYTYRRGRASGFYRLPSEEDRVDLRVYPNGFLPEIAPRMHAWTATVGARAHKGPWSGDVSLTHGGDSFRFRVENSLNASLGLDSPTEFDAGRLRFHQTSLNLDAVRTLELGAFDALALVLGAEARHEAYRIDAGQPESYELGPEVDSAGQPKAPGAQVFPGFRPDDETDENRQSVAAYLGIESRPTARTNLDVGGRVEHYSDFGNTAIGKVAGRVALVRSDEHEVALRGAASTGFRAPGLQQLWYSTIATQFFNDPVTGEPSPAEFLISPNRSALTQAFGVPKLREETSVNVSAGLTARLFGNLSLSADYYHVTIDDRIVLSGVFAGDDETIGGVVTDLIAQFPGVAASQFYVNAVDTTTDGLDLVLDHSRRVGGGLLKLTAAANFTETTVDRVNVPDSMRQRFDVVDGGAERVQQIFLGRYGRNLLEDLLPRVKGTLGARFDRDGVSVGLRANYFGPTEFHSDAEVDGEYLDESFGDEVTFDVDLGYRVGGLSWSLGANNVLDNFPDQVKRPENRSGEAFLYSPAAYSGGAPYGIAGAFYYARVEYQY